MRVMKCYVNGTLAKRLTSLCKRKSPQIPQIDFSGNHLTHKECELERSYAGFCYNLSATNYNVLRLNSDAAILSI